jgi:tetratricopeptide (TPR) repeat protein
MSGLAKVPGPVLAYVTDCARRFRENPSDPEGLLARALIFSALGRQEEARVSLAELSHVAPRHRVLLQLRQRGGVDLDALGTEADSVLRYVNACARRLEKDPKDADALFTRAVILATMGQHRDALASLEVLAKVAPHYPAVWRLKARLYKEVGDLRTAELCVRAAERFEEEGLEAREGPKASHSVRQKEADLIRRLILNEVQ